MPTYAWTARFRSDFVALTPLQQAAFLAAVVHFVEDLKRGRFRAGLRIKKVKGTRGILEMTWAKDGRATFQHGEPVRRDEIHVIWRRIGTHDIFGEP